MGSRAKSGRSKAIDSLLFSYMPSCTLLRSLSVDCRKRRSRSNSLSSVGSCAPM
ncbi:MAG: hypothetical protein IPJ65_39455 [Archangiaceae bacterium]|nr:hypothetical protein [Archangiaceae bacterium]